jgi:Fe-S cluster assembly iron-binding protein IscA
MSRNGLRYFGFTLFFLAGNERRCNLVVKTAGKMELTQKAAERVRRIKRIKKAEGFLRIRAARQGENRWLFEMGFDGARVGDMKVETCGLTVIMDTTTWKVLERAVVDFEGSDAKGEFTFTQAGR